MFGLLATVVVFLIVTLLRRRTGRTENVDGLLIEQQRRIRARNDRTSYSSAAVHHSQLNGTDPPRH
ncbi:hypothetical protein ACGFW5_24960 [Streptomyces sp. NPDC048416]|uniref:hypothetical protein n=1 Tax=Streptomyces sp. NPDC048416 TaxID=3365546 RepID=UPI003721F04B